MASVSNQDSSYKRLPLRKILSFPRYSHDSIIPQQVHISVVGSNKMRISWITQKPAPSKVEYGTSSGVYDECVEGSSSSYKYVAYKSGQIHEAVIGPLNPNTRYYYLCSCDTSREFCLKTPPHRFPIKFAIVGDLGQTEWTKSTLNNISTSNYDILLLAGDLSYADYWQPSWDSFGRMVEPLASQIPWMTTIGNHETEKIPIIHPTPFTAYNSRWRMPFEECGSSSNLFYSFDVPNAVHVIMLGSYTDFNPGSTQYKWLEKDLKKIDRNKTPWVVVVLHSPWYNSNKANQGEKESVDMRKAMECLLYDARVDLVIGGHVHAYERFTRVYDGIADPYGPMYITVSDAGNRQGKSKSFIDPKPSISIHRDGSYGHGELSIINSKEAQWSWFRNEDDKPVLADTCCLTNLAFDSHCATRDNHSHNL